MQILYSLLQIMFFAQYSIKSIYVKRDYAEESNCLFHFVSSLLLYCSYIATCQIDQISQDAIAAIRRENPNRIGNQPCCTHVKSSVTQSCAR